jgi:hypothetical protein
MMQELLLQGKLKRILPMIVKLKTFTALYCAALAFASSKLAVQSI